MKLRIDEDRTIFARVLSPIPGFLTVPQGEAPFPLIVLPHGGPFVQETIVIR
jgi:hypothetical protein